MDGLRPLGATAAPARAGDQVAAEPGPRISATPIRTRSTLTPLLLGAAVGDDPHVDARRRRRHQALRQRLAQPGQAATGLRLADHDVGGAALADDLGGALHEVVALLDQEVGAEHRGEVAQRRHLPLDLALDRLVREASPRAGRGRCRAAAPSARRGAPGAARRAAGGPAPAAARRPPSAPRRRPAPRGCRAAPRPRAASPRPPGRPGAAPPRAAPAGSRR